MHIQPNEARSLKTGYSNRTLPVPAEAIRLGLIDYRAAMEALGYEDLFPDLYNTNSPRERSCGLSDPTGEEHSAGCVEEGGCGCDGGFGILPKPSVATEPGEGALDHPPAGLDDEGVLRRRSFHDLHGDRRGVANAWPAAFTGLDRLAVHDGRRRAGLAPRPLAVGLAEGMRHPLEHPFVAKAAEPVTHRALGREALGQERPGQPVRRT